MGPARPTIGAAIGMAIALQPASGGAWIYPEHRDIAIAGIAKLSPADRAALDGLWAGARAAIPGRLCESLDAGDQGARPGCIDFAAWPALAGDHSCSPLHLMRDVLPGDWVLRVAGVAAETKTALQKADGRVARLNAVATSNLALQNADSNYVTRAGANNAHFLLPRVEGGAAEYMRASIGAGAPLNAMGLYVQYHLAALAAVAALASDPPAEESERAAQALDVLALEGYALHWLEDGFSAGHVVGTWGSAAWRKGTHDYYSEFGLDTVDWNGDRIAIFGDANLKPADLARASSAVAQSLIQFVQAMRPGDALARGAGSFGPGFSAMFAFDSCTEERQPASQGEQRLPISFWEGLSTTPVPGRGQGEVHLPRFRDELGPFGGVFASLAGGPAWGGPSNSGTRGTGSVSVGARVGYGMEGVTGSVGTGLAFAEVGLEMTTPQLDQCQGSACGALGTTSLFPRVPARTGLRLGLRVPFWLIPGDMLLLGPVLLLASPSAASKVGVAAASGGLIPYERSFRTGAGIFQFVLGREVQGTLYGYLGDSTIPLFITPVAETPSGPQYGVLALKSVALAFPVIEWTPFRTFATQIAFSLQFQLGFGVEIPLSRQVLYPAGQPAPSVPLSWTVFLRLQSDGRYFFGSREDLQPPRG
jgi:hypothetical protein